MVITSSSALDYTHINKENISTYFPQHVICHQHDLCFLKVFILGAKSEVVY